MSHESAAAVVADHRLPLEVADAAAPAALSCADFPEDSGPQQSDCLLTSDPAAVHVISIPGRRGSVADWPEWVDARVALAYQKRGISAPWVHQVQAAQLTWEGQHVGLVTGTASGKSAAYGLPGLTHALTAPTPGSRGPTVMYVSPTKALAQDQLCGLTSLGLVDLRVATYDGDTPREMRAWVRANARWLITNPDMLHRALLPDHERWRGFLRNLRLVVLDECHYYRGVFGAHIALLMRRLLRLAGHYGAAPAVMATSATAADPAQRLSALIGAPVTVVDVDASERSEVTLVLWQPREIDNTGQRRGVLAESSLIAAELIQAGAQTLVFTRSRRGAETVATSLRSAKVPPGKVAAYRGGFLSEERRELESELRAGRLRGLAATNALELGIDISGLDAVVIAGWPGSRASFLQQSGRAGRRGRPATAVLVAGADPLDQYLVSHPEMIVGAPLESAAFDVSNPYVLSPHLAAAAAELPLTDMELPEVFGATAPQLMQHLAGRGLVRHRARGWHWTCQTRASDLTDLRGAGDLVRIVESQTGRLLGTIDAASALTQTHEGAVYTHQGLTYLVTELDLTDKVAHAVRANVDYETVARQTTQTDLGRSHQSRHIDGLQAYVGEIEVIGQVTSYLKRRWPSGEVLGEFPLDLPPTKLSTIATWWVIDPELLRCAAVATAEIPGTLHAVEHAAIGLLPLVVTCDRWDIGGSSIACHPQTGAPTVVVYDGAPGGAGFAKTGYARLDQWLRATTETVRDCPCVNGCPSCVQSPKCGSGNNPLNKNAAGRVLAALTKLLC